MVRVQRTVGPREQGRERLRGGLRRAGPGARSEAIGGATNGLRRPTNGAPTRGVRRPGTRRACHDHAVGLAVGIDLVQVSRLAARADHATFLDRAFTPAEQQWCAGDPTRLAGRWAAKEAAMKALGRGLGQIPMTDIEVLAEPSGAPRLELAGAAADAAGAAGWTSWAVSIAHDGGYATAVVVAQVG